MPKFPATGYNYLGALLDQNAKVIDDGGIAKLQLMQDLFGTALDVHWTPGPTRFANPIGTVVEAAGLITFNQVGAGAAFGGRDLSYPFVYNNIATLDVEGSWVTVGNGSTQTELSIYSGPINYVAVFRERHLFFATDTVRFGKNVGGVWTQVASVNTGVNSWKLRLYRNGNNFSGWYDIGGGWVLFGNTVAAIPGNCTVRLNNIVNNTWAPITATVNYDNLQITGSGIYWDDDPGIEILKSGKQYAIDAGVDATFEVNSFADTKIEPGTSSVVYQMSGRQDLADPWNALDVAWRTLAQLNTQAALGDYDGYRYLKADAQFKSPNAVDQPTLTDFTINGRIINARKNHHNRMRRIKYGMSRIG